MLFTLFIVLTILGFVLHEAGHAAAMRSKGVEFKEVVLGFGPKVLFEFPRWLPGVKFGLGLLPLGAYVLMTPKGLARQKRLSAADQALIMGAGIIANLWYTAFLLIVFMWAFGDLPFAEAMNRTAFLLAFSAFLWFVRRPFSMYAIPVLGLAFVAFIVRVLWDTPTLVVTTGNVEVLQQMEAQTVAWGDAVFNAAMMSFGVALLNAIPLFVFDGGKIVNVWLERWKVKEWVQVGYAISSLVIVGILLLAPIVVDLVIYVGQPLYSAGSRFVAYVFG